MKRCSPNFCSDGVAMTKKFHNLIQLLMYYDPEFYCYLKRKNAHELFFCYRWLLLDLKREFPFEDALRSLEVIWSSIPPQISPDLLLFDVESRYHPIDSIKVSSFTNHPNIDKFCNDLNSRIRRGRFDEEIFNRKLEAECDEKTSSLDTSTGNTRRSRIEEDLNTSSGRGSMSASSLPKGLQSSSGPFERSSD